MYSQQKLLLKRVEFQQVPFQHFSAEQVLADDLASGLLAWLKTCDHWQLTKTSFYTQYEFSLREMELPKNLKFLNCAEFIDQSRLRVMEYFSIKKLELVGITAHKLLDGYRIGIHNDFIGKEETHRLVIQLNDSWNESNGGYLMLFNSKRANDVAKIIMPLHNTGLGFEISANSYHAVSTVHNFERYTLVYTFNKKEI